MAVVQKIIGSNAQPNGAQGIVSIAGARGLTAANKISYTLSPFPPLTPSQFDDTIAVTNAKNDSRFTLVNAYWPNSPSGVAVNP